VVFWLSLYLFERSWANMLGLSLTLLAYLGAATLLLDRLVLERAGPRSRARWPSPAPRRPDLSWWRAREER
jgi:hypothetical protein